MTSGIEIIGWAAVLLTALGIYFNANKSVGCWPIYLLANIFWTINLWGNVPAVGMQLILVVMNIYGWRKWTKQ